VIIEEHSFINCMCYSFDNTAYYIANQEFQHHPTTSVHMHVWETGEMHTRFWWGDMWERDRVEELDFDGTLILRSSLKSGMGRDGLHTSG